MNRTKEHSLIDILVIGICAMLCGADSFTDMEDFGLAKQHWLGSFLALPNGIASHDTFNRVFGLLNPQEFSDCFKRWTQGLRQRLNREVVAVDGKCVRRSFDQVRGSGPIHLVNAWALENRLVLGQVKTDAKSNEITAVPELLRNLELGGCIVTLDAMGCQRSIATEITNAEADYVLALKGNQGRAHDEVKTFLEDAKQRQFKGVKHDYTETVEKAHGRIETRRYWISGDIQWFADLQRWEGLRSVGMVEATREFPDGAKSTERRFYLTSLEANAQEFARAVRGHWAVENQLHWTLDVSFGEDQCRVRAGHAAENLALLRKMVLNILKRDTQKKRGIRGKQKNASWDHNYLLSLLTSQNLDA